MEEAMPRVPKSWLITDTHFNHSMLVEHGFRPADFQEQIICNWKKLVMAEDTVYHLGDVILGRNAELASILSGLPGKKILIRGNHDRESDGWYERAGFSFVAQAVLVGGVYLTHAPQVTLPDGAVINVHGHLHAGTHRTGPSQDWCKLLSLEDDGYKPVELIDFVGFSPLKRKILMPYEIEMGA
jgi:calcineurin-like phosphoesterase family protein